MSRDVMDRQPIAANERVAYGSDNSQFYDVYVPQGTVRGLTIHIHGGFWRSSFDLKHASHVAAGLSKAGYICASLEYRRVGETGGGWPTTFKDVASGFAAVRARFTDCGNPTILGHSAGGHLALLLAANIREIKGVVALAPVACISLAFKLNLGNGAVRDFMGGTPEQLPEFYAAADPVVHDSSVRRILVHGAADEIVPLSVSRTFFDARHLDHGPVTVLEIPGGDHFDPVDPASKAWPLVVSSVESL